MMTARRREPAKPIDLAHDHGALRDSAVWLQRTMCQKQSEQSKALALQTNAECTPSCRCQKGMLLMPVILGRHRRLMCSKVVTSTSNKTCCIANHISRKKTLFYLKVGLSGTRRQAGIRRPFAGFISSRRIRLSQVTQIGLRES